MKKTLFIILLITLGASQTAYDYFGITVPATGTITITSSWINSATVNMVYDVGGEELNIQLTNGSPKTFTASSSGKKLIYFQFGEPNPNRFMVSLTMPN